MHPILFKTPWGFEVHTFGVMMVLAFLGSIYLAQIRAARYGLSKAQVSDCAFWALVSGVLGARIAFIIQDLGWFLHHPSELLSLQFRGLTSFGGLIFGAIAVIVWAKRNKVSTWVILDLTAPAFVLGHAIGRVGCLMNGCCFGGVCPPGFALGVHVDGDSALHYPAQAYDTLMNLVVLGALLWREKLGLRLGQLTGLMLILHGATRVIYEFWRAGKQADVDRGLASSTYISNNIPVTQAQLMALALMLIGTAIFIFAGVKQNRSALTLSPDAHPA